MDDLTQRIDELEQTLAQIAGCARHQQQPHRRLAAIHRWASAALVPEPERSLCRVVEEWDS
jgi:hypothetical protein